MIKHATLSLCTNLTEQDLSECYCHLSFHLQLFKSYSQEGIATVNMLPWVKFFGFNIIEKLGAAIRKWTGIVEQDFVLAFIIRHALPVYPYWSFSTKLASYSS